jgi:hypothetical protein
VFGSAYQRRYLNYFKGLSGTKKHLKVNRSFPFVEFLKNRAHSRDIESSIYGHLFLLINEYRSQKLSSEAEGWE